MQTLSTSFTSKGFSFEQVKRQGAIAIYRKTKGRYLGYEVIRVRCRKARKMFGNWVEAHEAYPSNEEWGTYGFTCFTMAAAERRYRALLSASRTPYRATKERL